MKRYILANAIIGVVISQHLAQDVPYMFENTFYSKIGTYNNMKLQTGFCKMTGFETVSRNTSDGPPLFTSGRVQFGVGLSHYQFGSTIVPSLYNNTEGSMTCGMCINITHIENLPILNNELTDYDPTNSTKWHIAMIFDQCADPICTSGFLDIDVYADNIFAKSFTRNIVWHAIDCPIMENEPPQFLLCTVNTCNSQNEAYKYVSTFKELFEPTYFYIVVRNLKRPLMCFHMKVNETFIQLPFISGTGFTWNNYTQPFAEENFIFMMTDVFGNVTYQYFKTDNILNIQPTCSYTGGVLFIGE
jgi:hypothetical protein